MTDARRILDLAVREDELLAMVLELAGYTGWLVWHDHDSRMNRAGWPDLVLAKPGRPLCLWELKTERGRLRPAQERWLHVLQQVPGIDVRVVRPADWPAVEAFLKGEA